MTTSVRVRFAPSPTGLLHVGGARAALFNYLFAKNHHGKFILRIEDTDRTRLYEGATEQIFAGLKWLGIEPDEGYWLDKNIGDYGPYLQSQRLEHYQAVAQQLIDRGLAYYSHISDEDFAQRKADMIAQKKPFVYRASMEPAGSTGNKNLPIRLQIPAGQLKWHDSVYGEFDINNATIDDFVIMKADGYPTYNFANVVDDHMMEISHVLRGPEFVPSTPKHALLYDLLGWERPEFIHMPVILGPDGKKKLSKRDGDVDLMSYRDQGYLPEAMVNFLALLGWNDGTTHEFFDINELIKRFSTERIQKSPARFDRERLSWMNGHYIREGISLDELVKRLADFVPTQWLDDLDYFRALIELDRERFKTLTDANELLEFFFVEPSYTDDVIVKAGDKTQVVELLTASVEVIERAPAQHDELEKSLRQLAESKQVGAGKLFTPLRIAVTGRTQAPGIFDTILLVGTERSIERIRRFLSIIRKR